MLVQNTECKHYQVCLDENTYNDLQVCKADAKAVSRRCRFHNMQRHQQAHRKCHFSFIPSKPPHPV